MGYCKQPDVDCYGASRPARNVPEKCLRAEILTEIEVNHREEGHPSRTVQDDHHLPLRQRDRDSVYQAGYQGGNLLQVPSVLHRQAEAC